MITVAANYKRAGPDDADSAAAADPSDSPLQPQECHFCRQDPEVHSASRNQIAGAIVSIAAVL
jgi:hypothetical protein